LNDVHLDRNLLYGPLPSWLLKLSRTLQTLELWSNRFTGGLDILASLSALRYLGLPGNGLSGSINPLAQLTNLSFLSVCCNQGPFSDLGGISKLTKLEILNVWGGQLKGTLDAVKDLVNLQSLDLGANQLNGTIDAIKGLTRLKLLGLGSNRFTGSINAITSLTSLTTLRLEKNQYAGSIPPELVQLSSLSDISLSGNALTGP
jgi:Leucine-rich repeat (LRR) protein